MTITPLTRGNPGSQSYLESINDIKKVIVEVPRFRIEDCINMNLIDTGLRTGVGGGASTYPEYLYDGCILGRASLSQYSSDQKIALDIQAGGRRSGEYFDFAVGGSTRDAVAMVFTNGYTAPSGQDNPYHTKTGSADPQANVWTGDNNEIPTLNSKYRPGRLDSNAVQGITKGEAWIRAIHTTERSLSSYAAGDVLVVSEGLWKKGVAASGHIAYGDVLTVKTENGYVAMLIRFNFTNGHII